MSKLAHIERENIFFVETGSHKMCVWLIQHNPKSWQVFGKMFPCSLDSSSERFPLEIRSSKDKMLWWAQSFTEIYSCASGLQVKKVWQSGAACDIAIHLYYDRIVGAKDGLKHMGTHGDISLSPTARVWMLWAAQTCSADTPSWHRATLRMPKSSFLYTQILFNN